MWRLALLLLAAAPVAAQTDPLDAPACRDAMAALSAAEQGASGPALKNAQRRAARACLGTRADPPPAARRAEPPVAVPPVGVPAVPRAAVPPPALRPPPVAPRPLPPPAIVTCDAATCLTSDGQRLLRSGPTLIGPQGQCRMEGNLLACP